METIQTPWGRRSNTGLKAEGDPALEAMNPFDKARTVAAQRATVTPSTAPPKRFVSDWHDERGNSTPTASGGTVHSEETLRLKAAADAERQRTKQPVPVVLNQGLTLEKDWRSIVPLLEALLAQNSFHPSERNQECFWNAMRTFVDQGTVQFTLVDMERVTQWLLEHNYFESPTRRRGDPAPLFFEYEPPAPTPEAQATHKVNPTVKTIAADPAAEAEARNMSLDELRKKVRKDWKRLQRDGSYS